MIVLYQLLILFLVPLIIGSVIFCVHWLSDRKRRASAGLLPDRKRSLWKIFVPAFISIGLALLFAIPFSAITYGNFSLDMYFLFTPDSCMMHPEIECARYRMTSKEIMGSSYDYAAIEMALRYLLPGADGKSVCYTNLGTCQALDHIPIIDLRMYAEDINGLILIIFGIWSVSGYFVGQIMIRKDKKKRSGKTNFSEATR
jgi:hypothetical protein